LDMTLAGHLQKSQPVSVAAEDQLPGKVNYFLGNDPSKWYTGLPTYARVRYSAVYPGIDLVYYGNQRQLEFDFLVAPKADPAQIRLHFDAKSHLAINASGDLEVAAGNTTALLHKPIIYQQFNGKRQTISGSFQLEARGTVGFSLGSYDHSQPLIIDPILVYSTYLGGSGRTIGGNLDSFYDTGDQGNGIAVDSSGSTYVVGSAGSLNFPVTSDPYQSKNKSGGGVGTGNGGVTTGFISKFNSTGTALIYSTFLGGSQSDSANAIAIDSAGNAYIAGSTSSYDFPTTSGAFNTANTYGVPMAFVTKLNAAGNGLLYSTLLGGSNGTSASAIAIDSSGDAYLTGSTTSKDFPVSATAFQSKFLGQTYTIQVVQVTTTSSDAFVTKLNPTGSALLYSTYLGGSGAFLYDSFEYGDQGNGIAIDSSGDAYVAGLAYSKDFPVTTGSLQLTNNGWKNGQPNAFITKLNSTGSSLVYSTYLGGSGINSDNYSNTGDYGSGIAVDGSGDAYVAGSTFSTDFPTTTGVLETAGNSNGTGFVSKLNPAGSSLLYSTHLGGPGTVPSALAIDDTGVAYITGSASSVDFPESPDALPQGTPLVAQTITKAFVAKLNANATGIEYATLLGGTGRYQGNNEWVGDGATALALGAGGDVFVTGGTYSSDFPVTSGAFQPRNNSVTPGASLDYASFSNAFVSELALATETASHVTSQGTITALPAMAKSGQTVTFASTVTGASGSGTPTGTVTISEFPSGLVLSPAVALNSSGQATWTSSTLAPGLYQVYGRYSGDATHLSNTATGHTATFRVVGPPAILTDVAEPYYCQTYGGQCGFTVQVTDSASYPLQGVTVSFSGANLGFSASSAVTNSMGQATVTVTSLKMGNLVATASVSGVSQTVTLPIQVYLPAPLTVILHPITRLYGSANPSGQASFVGLVGSDTLTVTQQTTATPASPVGLYPVTGTVSGAAASNYTITIQNTTLTVSKAPLYISAKNVAITYGQTPPPITAYTLSGFVNGDTASVVSGAPVLTTTVTSTTPVGFYKIGVQVGTLAAANYYFNTFSSGEGSVGVYKAPLKATANNLTMTQGGPVPTLTYTLAGFVNGQSSSVVSGAPVLSTTATSASTPGHYPITLSVGTLSAQNYSFTPVAGVLTVLP
jgi:hypothetical protein